MISYYWIIFLYLVAILQCSADDKIFLGKSIYVPSEDLLGSIPNGITFFENISEDCFRKVEHQTLIKEQSFFQNTEDFFKSVAVQTNLKAEHQTAFSLGVTLDVTTKRVSGNKRSVSGTSLNIARQDFDLQFSPNCLYETNLQSRVLEDFSKLPVKIPRPWFKDSWREYETFLDMHGSHVITAVTFGASIDQHAFGEESSSYTEKQFTTKACTALPGEAVGAMGLSLSACAGLNKNDMKNITDTKMTTKITVRGGSMETRNKLLYDKSPDVILKFLSEGHTNPSPIKYKLTPIWQILNGQVQVKQSNPNRNVQAANMQYYFDGYLNFNCAFIPADDRGPILQKFDYAERSTPEHPVFQCTLAPEGCHHNNDCHHAIGSGCVCYGNSCIRHENVEQSSGDLKPKATRYHKKDWSGQGTCDWKIPGISCRCKNERLNRLIIF